MTSFSFQHIPLSQDDFVDRTSVLLSEEIKASIIRRGRCALGLSGGSTPRPVYEALSRRPDIDWSRVHVFLVDDRCVPPIHDDSNQKLVRESLLDRISIPDSNIVFPDTTVPIDACVRKYEQDLGKLLLGGSADILTLGLGEDGHIASLFPGDSVALLEEEHGVLHTMTARFAVRDRITVTFPILCAAQRSFFLLRGEGKREIFARVTQAEFDPLAYPAHPILHTGRSVWITVW